MKTMELEAKKASLVRDILVEVNDIEVLRKLQKAYERVKTQVKKKEEESVEYISKEEVLEGIDVGLKEMQERKRSGRKAKTLQALIDEL